MAEITTKQLRKLIGGIGIRQVRLACGLILFAYLVSHFLNHALGNVSAEALAAGVYYHTTLWQFLPVAILFYAAATVHTGLGVWAVYDRRQFRWKAIEPLQLVLGLSIPALIIAHLVGVRLGQTLFDHEKLYPQVFYAYWVAWPYKMWLMFLVLLVAWTHGCIGLYFWLRMKAFYKRAAPFLLAAAVLIPLSPCSDSIRADAPWCRTATPRNGKRKIFRGVRSALPRSKACWTTSSTIS